MRTSPSYNIFDSFVWHATYEVNIRSHCRLAKDEAGTAGEITSTIYTGSPSDLEKVTTFHVGLAFAERHHHGLSSPTCEQPAGQVGVQVALAARLGLRLGLRLAHHHHPAEEPLCS